MCMSAHMHANTCMCAHTGLLRGFNLSSDTAKDKVDCLNLSGALADLSYTTLCVCACVCASV